MLSENPVRMHLLSLKSLNSSQSTERMRKQRSVAKVISDAGITKKTRPAV